MNVRIGLWIDRARAILVSLAGRGDPSVRVIESEVEDSRRSFGFEGRPAQGQVHGSPERKFAHRRQNELHRFFRQVIKAIGRADEILILGPGLAKGQLHAEIKREPSLAKRVRAVKTVERMTEPQLIALTRRFFTGRQRIGRTARSQRVSSKVSRSVRRKVAY